MRYTVPYWRRILLANAAGALAVIGINGRFAPDVPWSAFWKACGTALVFANCIGTLLALTVPLVAAPCWKRRYRFWWPVLIATIVVMTAAGTLLANTILFAFGQVPREQFWAWSIGSFEVAIVISTIICIAITAYEIVRNQLEAATLALRTKERDEADARRIATEAQLAALESRVHPHFLFNTLNSIAALVHDDPSRAERMTTQLASLLRSSLDQESPLVPLADELHVVRSYLEIERVRFGERLRYAIDADGALDGARVPRLAIQTLVENSVKYAVSPRRGGAAVAVRAAAANGHVRLEVEDDGPGFDAATLPDEHGLALLRARLSLAYGDRASFLIDSRPGRTTITVSVPTAVGAELDDHVARVHRRR